MKNMNIAKVQFRRGGNKRVPLRDRRSLVSEAAYYLAEKRGFIPGDELKDWLVAERQIDALLSREHEC